MSKALRCDRCGTAFSPILMENTWDLFTTIPELFIQTSDNYRKTICNQRKTDLNFCPKCTNDFLKFMEDFENETSVVAARMSVDRYNAKLDELGVGKYEYGGSQGNCDGETAERET